MKDQAAQADKTLRAAYCLCALGLLWFVSGCNRNPYANPYAAGAYPATPFGAPPAGTWQPPVGANTAFTQPQLAELERRVQQLDANNRQLTTQLAQSQQQMQVFRDRADLLQKQLADTNSQLQAARLAQQELQGQARGLQASMNQRGGATIRPNTSQPNAMQSGSMQPGTMQPGSAQPYQPLPSTQISNRLPLPNDLSSSAAGGIQVPGAVVEQAGDLIRVRIPSDQLFTPGTAQIGPSAYQILDAFAASIARSYPRQRVTVEAHTDSGNLYGGAFSNQVQLGHAQSQAVIDQLVRRSGLPAQQMSAVSHGPNYPRADNGTAAGRAENRRIEFVIYPAVF